MLTTTDSSSLLRELSVRAIAWNLRERFDEDAPHATVSAYAVRLANAMEPNASVAGDLALAGIALYRAMGDDV